MTVEQTDTDPAQQLSALQRELADTQRRLDLALTPDSKQLIAAKEREIYGLRQDLERAERAAGRVVAAKQRTWEDVAAALGVEAGLADAPARCLDAVRGYQQGVKTATALYNEAEDGRLAALDTIDRLQAESEAHKADVLRLEDVVERHGLNAAHGREADRVAPASELRRLADELSIAGYGWASGKVMNLIAGREQSDDDTAAKSSSGDRAQTLQQCIDHMAAGGICEVPSTGFQRRIHGGETQSRMPGRAWTFERQPIGDASAYRLLPIEAKP